MKITVVGLGYVGLSLALLLAQEHDVLALDIDPEKVQLLQNGGLPIDETQMRDFLAHEHLNLRFTADPVLAYTGAHYIVVATSTNYDVQTSQFDTQSVERVLAGALAHAPEATLVIKSTVPIGFTDRMREELQCPYIIFSPEFLREGQALHDNLYPSRIVVGAKCERALAFARLLKSISRKPDVPVLFTGSAEAEAIKLFANTYLAMRIAYFNELDTFALSQGLVSSEIIEGMGLDPRIGDNYNNPSFGYGGYCLPKDSQQLLRSYEGLPQTLITATVEANTKRKAFIAQDILRRRPKLLGVYRLTMKAGSDNFRSSILGVIELLQAAGQPMAIYEPLLAESEFLGCSVLRDLQAFKQSADLILTNRQHTDLADVLQKVYTRDILGKD